MVARVVDFTVGAMAFVEEDDLDVVLLLHRRGRPRRDRGGQGAAARGRRPRARRRGVRQGAGAALRARRRPPGAEETALGGFAAFPVGDQRPAARACWPSAARAPARIAAETEAFLGQVANQANIVMENSRLFERVRNLSIRDGLTGLFNHRHTMELVANEFERVGRYEGGVSLLMVDIDHFKKVNDEHGHQAGDEVLREVARILKDTLREVDSLGRYGGEEFVAILPPHDHERGAADRRAAARGHRRDTLPRRARASCASRSASAWRPTPRSSVDSPGALVREADKALYRAKQAGRNQVS